MLSRLGFHFICRAQVWYQACVDIENIFRTNITFHLANCFKKWQGFNVPDSAADFGDNDIGIAMLGSAHNLFLNHVGDVGDDLNRCAEIFTAAFALQDFRINFPGCDIAVLVQVNINKPLIMAKVEVSLSTIIGDKHFTMLIRVHGAWVNVDIWIKFLNRNLQTAIL